MFHRTCIELGDKIVIDVERVQTLVLNCCSPVDGTTVLGKPSRRHTKRSIIPALIGVARVLSEGPRFIETMLELITEIDDVTA